MKTESDFLKEFVSYVADAVKGDSKGEETAISGNGHLNRGELRYENMVNLHLSRFLRWMLNLCMYWDYPQRFMTFWNNLGHLILIASTIGDDINREHERPDHWKKCRVHEKRKALLESFRQSHLF